MRPLFASSIVALAACASESSTGTASSSGASSGGALEVNVLADGCHDVANAAPGVAGTSTHDPAASSVETGGTIQDGLYFVTLAKGFGVPADAPVQSWTERRTLAVKGSDVFETIFDRGIGSGTDVRRTFSLTTSGTKLTLTAKCVSVDGLALNTRSYEYTASGTSLRLVQRHDDGQVSIREFTRQ